jgi:hypothetical protein
VAEVADVTGDDLAPNGPVVAQMQTPRRAREESPNSHMFDNGQCVYAMALRVLASAPACPGSSWAPGWGGARSRMWVPTPAGIGPEGKRTRGRKAR